MGQPAANRSKPLNPNIRHPVAPMRRHPLAAARASQVKGPIGSAPTAFLLP